MPIQIHLFVPQAIATILLVTAQATLGAPPPGATADIPPGRAAVEFFETSIRPVLVESCQKCHGPGKQSSGLRVDSREAMLKGGDTGPAVVPGKPAESLLVQAVEQTHEDLKMPPKGKLQSQESRRSGDGSNRVPPGARRLPDDPRGGSRRDAQAITGRSHP